MAAPSKKAGKSECIRVIIRCRPMSKDEMRDGRECVVEMNPNKGEILLRSTPEDVPKQFTFDCVYDWNSQQENVFAETAYPIIENVLEGYNGTIFAYGQTGCGKTHTMMGLKDDPEQRGIIPNAFEHIFGFID